MLHGRLVEAATVESLVAGARSSESAALVVRGEPGVGKSALLLHAEEQATGMRVLRSVGIEAESELAFAGLHQLLHPILDRLERLPAPQAAALGGALGLRQVAVADRFLVGVGVLSLLAEAAEEAPLLAVIDDAHWLDQPSADALVFAARRLEAEGIVLLFVGREGGVRRFEAPGLPELMLTGLERDAANALLAERARSPLAPDVRDRLVESSGGNPLALIELPSLLSDGQLAGREALPDPLPESAEMERAFSERARRLPAVAQRLLLVVSADDSGSLATVLDAAARLGVEPEALDLAEMAELVQVSDGNVAVHHPLIRSALYRGATSGQRREAHRALAEVLDREQDADRRAWHRAAASVGQDEDVADELELTAERARQRSGFAAAARTLERAAELSGDDEARGRRLARAAQDAWLAGRPDHALTLLAPAARLVTDPHVRADVMHLRGTIELRCGVPADALVILSAGAAEIEATAPARATEMLIEAGQSASYAGDTSQVVEMGRRAKRLLRADDADQRFSVDVLAGVGHLLAGDTAQAVPLLREALELAAGFQDPRRLVHAGACAGYLGDEATELELYSRAAARAREEGGVGTLPYVLEYLARAEAVNGRYAAAAAHASEGLRLASETRQLNSICHLLASLALIASVRGREDDCRSYAADALEQAEARGLGYQAALAEWALARLDVGFGRSADALVRLEQIAAAGTGAGHPFVKLVSTADLVEAAVRVAETARAETALAGFERFAQETAPQWALALAARCRGLLCVGATADRHFLEALRRHGKSTRPFDRARTQLVFGESLRRTGRRNEARTHLRAALEAFERAGAASWSERTRTELRASGETARKRVPIAVDQLTPQELQVTQFVAEGATNKEVAARLFLSPRTIDYHLRKVFTKLEITSRSELIRLSLAEDAAARTRGVWPAGS